MKIILLQDVKGTGRAGEVVEVSPGHGRNFLIPRKMAMEATEANMRILEKKRQEIEARREVDLKRAEEIREQIDGKTLVIESKAGDGGRLFGAITAKDLADAMKAQWDVTVDRRKIELPAPIKQLGVSQVEVKLFSGISASCQVEVKG